MDHLLSREKAYWQQYQYYKYWRDEYEMWFRAAKSSGLDVLTKNLHTPWLS